MNNMTALLEAPATARADTIGVSPWEWLGAVRDSAKLTLAAKHLAWVLASHSDEFGCVSACSRSSAQHYWISDAGIRAALAIGHALEDGGFIRTRPDGGTQLTIPIAE